MRSLLLFGAGMLLASLPTAALAQWTENFDAYANGSSMHGQGGWKGWDNDSQWTAYVTDIQALSSPHSVEIVGTSDLVHEYCGCTFGKWTYTAWQYIPTDFQGESYFILLNTYADGGTNNWSTQVRFDDEGFVESEFEGVQLPLITGQWVELRNEIDLNADTQSFYYDGQLLTSKSWTEGVSGGGVLNIGAVDLFANGASPVYYDDLSLVSACPGDLDNGNDVGLADLSMLLSHYGMVGGVCYDDGDLDFDEDVDLADLGALLSVYGTICP